MSLSVIILALACGYSEAALSFTPDEPSMQTNAGALCCKSEATMAAITLETTVFSKCSCQHANPTTGPAESQRIDLPKSGENWYDEACGSEYIVDEEKLGGEWCEYPQGVCPYGYYEKNAVAFDSCQFSSGNKLVGFAKISLTAGNAWATSPSVLTMPKGLQGFQVVMVCSEDFDMLIGYDGYTDSDGKKCIVGRDCTFDRATLYNTIEGCFNGVYTDATDGVFCIQESDFTNLNPDAAAATWYWSGATEGSNSEEKFAAKSIANRDYDIKIFPAATAFATLTYQFNGMSPCPDFPLPSTCGRNPTVEVSGDPHMRNLDGEVFDLSQEGEHILIQIPAGSGEDLEVIGTVNAFHKKRKCPTFFLTGVKLQGTFVGKHPLQIISDKDMFAIKHGSKLVKLDMNAPVSLGSATAEMCNEENVICKSTIPRRRTPSFAEKLHVQLPSALDIVVSNYESAHPSFINLAISGLQAQHAVGGILGHGDHSHVTSEPECKKKPSNRKTSMLQQPYLNVQSITVGHLAL